MFDELVEIPDPEDCARVENRYVRMCLLGIPADVDEAIAVLHNRKFGEVSAWSKPLTLAETSDLSTLHPSEVMQVYKRYNNSKPKT